MRSSRLAFTFAALTLATAVPATAFAGSDKSGSEGRAESVEVNAPSSDRYLQFHGRIFIESGNTTTEYRWGGTSCGSRTMAAEMIALLVGAVEERDDIVVKPTYQDGQGSTKCLVGFALENKKKKNGGPR